MDIKQFLNRFQIHEIGIDTPTTQEKPPIEDVPSLFDIPENEEQTAPIEDIENEFISLFENLRDALGINNEENNNKTKEETTTVSVGDVFDVPGTKYLYIKTGDNSIEKLNITRETYNKLFEEENTKKTEEREGLFELLGLTEGNNKISNSLEEILSSDTTKQNLLKCFSEDENGNITVTIPGNGFSYTFDSDFDLSELDSSGELSNSDVGIQLLELTFGAMLQQEEIEISQNTVEHYQMIENKYKDIHSEELTNKLKEIVKTAKEKGLDIYDIHHGIRLILKDHPLEEVNRIVGDEIFNLISQIPKEEIEKTHIKYVEAIVILEDAKPQLEELLSDPFDSKHRNRIFEKDMIFSSLGLDINGNEISEEALSFAEKFIESSNIKEDTTCNKNLIAAYINNNEYGVQLLNKFMQSVELNYDPSQLKTLLKESLKDDADIEFLTKTVELGWPPNQIFNRNYINKDNIELALFFERCNPNDSSNWEDFEYINIATNYLNEDKLKEIIANGNHKLIEEITQELSNNHFFKDFNIEENTIRSNLLAQDIQLAYEAAVTGQKIEDLSVKTMDSAEIGLTNSEVGDVYEVAGEENIYIKISDNEYKQLNISKEAYNKLYPPVQRYMSSQGKIGDCYLVSSLNNMMTNPETRHILLECFSEDEYGNITVDLPNGDYTFTLENGKEITDYLPEKINLREFDTGDKYSVFSEKALSDSSLGMQMLELCYGIYLKDKETKDQLRYIDIIATEEMLSEEINCHEEELAEKLEYGKEIIELLSEYITKENYTDVFECLREISYGKNLYENKNFIYENILNNATENEKEKFERFSRKFMNCHPPINYINAIEKFIELQGDTYGSALRGSGGWNKDVFNAFGIECKTYKISNSHTISDLLENPNIKIISGGTIGNSDDDDLNKKLNISARHAYTIYPIQQENGEWLFEVINPHDESKTSILTEEQINEYFQRVDYIYIN